MNTKKSTTNAVVFPAYSISEEIANSILHGLGVLGAIAGMVLLTLKAAGFLSGQGGDALNIVAVIIYTAAMIGMYLISTLYHAVQHKEAKSILRRLDHSLIFIFIAGTYTPFCLINMRGGWGWSIFGVEWFMALFGIILNVLDVKNFKKIEVAVYILMGWVIVVGFVPLVQSVPIVSIVLLITGGIVYTLGTIWYRKKNLKYSHVVWHVFVLFGTIFHWFAVWFLL